MYIYLFDIFGDFCEILILQYILILAHRINMCDIDNMLFF